MNKSLLSLTLASTILILGCQAPSTYYWANYEPLIYSSFANPGKIPTEEQIDILIKDIADSQSENKPLPPGFYAHLGYLYYQIGDSENALNSFNSEKELFPESTILVDRLINRIQNDEVP